MTARWIHCDFPVCQVWNVKAEQRCRLLEKHGVFISTFSTVCCPPVTVDHTTVAAGVLYKTPRPLMTTIKLLVPKQLPSNFHILRCLWHWSRGWNPAWAWHQSLNSTLIRVTGHVWGSSEMLHLSVNKWPKAAESQPAPSRNGSHVCWRENNTPDVAP